MVNKTPGASYASRTMIWSGIIVFAFLVYHLLHFTLGRTDPANYVLEDAMGRHDVYTMVLRGFQNPIVAVSYMIAVGLLCWHLSHGVASFFRSLGVMNKRWRRLQEQFAIASAVVLYLGFVSVPASVLLGVVK
jgi:succinate dehydrogenase / fumarate reductase cytochrome b subunit